MEQILDPGEQPHKPITNTREGDLEKWLISKLSNREKAQPFNFKINISSWIKAK